MKKTTKTEIKMTMKKNEQYHIDPIGKRIILTKKFLKEAGSLNAPEHKILMELMETHPDYELIERKIKKAENKTKYKGLNAAKMREFITWRYRDDADTQTKKLNEFDARAKFYDDFHKAEKGAAMRSWFLKNHKEEYLDWEKTNVAA